MKVLCFGFGFVGKAYALLLREQGHEVKVITAFDKTATEAMNYGFGEGKVCMYVNPITHIPYLPNKIWYDAICISVPTPTIKEKQDISILESVFKDIKPVFNTKYIFLKSTTTSENIHKLEKCLNKEQQLIMYPEFLTAKNPIGGVFNQKIRVFGKKNKWKKEEKEFVYKLFGFDKDSVTFTNLETAAMLKYVHNLWLASILSFWNAMLKTTKDKRVDFNTILKETHKSPYFGTYPWFIGKAYGGTCLPKDIKAYISSVKKDGIYKRYLRMIDDVNEEVLKDE